MEKKRTHLQQNLRFLLILLGVIFVILLSGILILLTGKLLSDRGYNFADSVRNLYAAVTNAGTNQSNNPAADIGKDQGNAATNAGKDQGNAATSAGEMQDDAAATSVGEMQDDAAAADRRESCVARLEVIAEGFAAAAEKPMEEILNPAITRKEVYELESGTRVTGKERKRRGGAGRWFQIYKIKKGSSVYRRIAGRSYKPGGAVSLSDLRYIRVLYYDFDGKVRSGEIIVNRSIADDTLAVFRKLYKAKYQIRKMCLVDDYFPSSKTHSDDSESGKRSDSDKKKSSDGGSKTSTPVWSSAAAEAADTASMNDDNTSGFNYRMVAGTSSVSMHGYGRAIDINPFENPWCPGGTVYRNQRQSAAYANRSNMRPHMIYADSEVTRLFKKYGFRWLGETGTRDYQHFER